MITNGNDIYDHTSMLLPTPSFDCLGSHEIPSVANRPIWHLGSTASEPTDQSQIDGVLKSFGVSEVADTAQGETAQHVWCVHSGSSPSPSRVLRTTTFGRENRMANHSQVKSSLSPAMPLQ